jgi:hypothetical protein
MLVVHCKHHRWASQALQHTTSFQTKGPTSESGPIVANRGFDPPGAFMFPYSGLYSVP